MGKCQPILTALTGAHQPVTLLNAPQTPSYFRHLPALDLEFPKTCCVFILCFAHACILASLFLKSEPIYFLPFLNFSIILKYIYIYILDVHIYFLSLIWVLSGSRGFSTCCCLHPISLITVFCCVLFVLFCLRS